MSFLYRYCHFGEFIDMTDAFRAIHICWNFFVSS